MRFSNVFRLPIVIVTVSVSAGCSLSDLVNRAELPSELKDPAALHTRDGALEAYRGTVIAFAKAVAGGNNSNSDPENYLYVTGLFTDELRAVNITSDFPGGSDGPFDNRNIQNLLVYNYETLNNVRAIAQETRGLLRQYAPFEPVALLGHLYAMEGYIEIMLADFYCSGIPLGQLQYGGDYTVTRGFSTAEVYEHAMTLFDSASKYATDSSRILYLADVGRGRALIALGEYTQAETAVQRVPENYRYTLTYASTRPKTVPRESYVVVADRDGINGLPFASGNDPRIAVPDIYNPAAPLVLASGVEAQLIEVEAAIQAGRTNWLTQLNAVRTTCTDAATCPSPAPGGTGNVNGLPPLSDPAASLPAEQAMAARIDLLFQERAYWLFLTGHRQGDLRRLVRQYQRVEYTVYPTGLWGVKRIAAYGTDVNIPVPDMEVQYNPLYNGCLDRNA